MAHDDAERSEPVLIPRPQTVRWVGRDIEVGWLVVVDLPDALLAYRSYLAELAGHVSGRPGIQPLIVKFDVCVGDSEEYMLMVDPNQVRIRASDARGALHGMRTVVDLWESTGRRGLPAVTIMDKPDFAVRGLHVEPGAGTSHMALVDWRQLIDRFAELKLNLLGISLDGCDEAVLGDVVSYARERGVEILPYFNGPGHSALISHSLPESSAIHDGAYRTGHNLCVTVTSMRDEMARFLRYAACRYLLSNGIRQLHVAADEPNKTAVKDDCVTALHCRCANCCELSYGEMLLKYLTLVGQVLAEDEISMVHWHDSLARAGMLDEYARRCAELGIPEPTIVWRQHNDLVPYPVTGRAQTWSSPAVGSIRFGFLQDHLPTIESALRLGRESGITGVLARGTGDTSDYMNYAFLADLAWRYDAFGGVESFRQRWARYICPGNPEKARYALMKATTVTACPPLITYVNDQLSPYRLTGATVSAGAPEDIRNSSEILAHSALNDSVALDVLRQVADTLREAASLMPEGRRSVPYWGHPVAIWRDEITRVVTSLDLFLGVLAATRRPESPEEAEISRLEEQATYLLRLTVNNRAPYEVPLALRSYWTFIWKLDAMAKRHRDRQRLRPGTSCYD